MSGVPLRTPLRTPRALLDEILSTRTVEAPDGSRLPLHSELPAAEGAVLQHWLRESGARSVLEIGCAYGVSSLYICEALGDRDIDGYHIIDAFQHSQWRDVGRRHLALAGAAGRVTLHEELSELCLPRLLAAGQRFDFAYVDGWHTFDQVLLESYYVNRMLDPGGVLVFDDVHLPAVRKAIACLATWPCFEPLPPPAEVASTLAARVRRAAGVPPIRLQALRKTGPDERDWDWFAEF